MEPIARLHKRQFMDPANRVGATYVKDQGVHIRIWAPLIQMMEIEWLGASRVVLNKGKDGYFTGLFADRKPGDKYYFYADNHRIPDPASRHQPEGLFGPSQVVEIDYEWSDDHWKGVPYEEWVIYEIHVGTYSEKHNFEGVIDDLPRLRDLGINAIEIMPVSQFSGARNWGYDGVLPHSVQDSYGGPKGLKALVDACHKLNMACILDVVYNHIGPEGNILPMLGPYFQQKYKTPWGDALNFDGAHSEDVRNYFLQTAWQWMHEFHMDGLRLDAIHTIFDVSPIPFLEELSRLKTEEERERMHPIMLIAETEMNDSRILAKPDNNGLGMDAHWADDLHHVLHVMITNQTDSYYRDYGGLDQLWRTYARGVAFEGDFSFNRSRCHGRSYEGIDKKRLVVCSQNHDQIGNRIEGKRLNVLVDFEKLKLMSASIFLSPFTPMIFMGEEWGCTKPFHYFVSHTDTALLEAIRKGRASEFELEGQKADPAAEDIFEDSVLSDRPNAMKGQGAILNQLHRELISLSKNIRRHQLHADRDEENAHIILSYTRPDSELSVVLSFNPKETVYILPEMEGRSWKLVLQTSAYIEGEALPGPRDVKDSVSVPAFSALVLAVG